MPLTSSITPYNEQWPALFQHEEARLLPVFGASCLDFQHVGSTAVRGLSAKPEIDILVIVSSTDGLDRWHEALLPLRYRRGGDLSVGHHFFKRDENGVRTHKLHVCEPEHPTALKMLRIRDHLRHNTEDREAYQDLKRQLEQENRDGIAEYLRGKAPFLDALYDKIQRGAS